MFKTAEDVDNIKIFLGDNNVSFVPKCSFSPVGEMFITLSDVFKKNIYKNKNVCIRADIVTPNDIMALLLTTDAIRRCRINTNISLVLPYLPFSRQNKTDIGESFSIKVFGNLINSQNYVTVTTHDVHNDMAFACIDRLINIPKIMFIDDILEYLLEKSLSSTYGILLVSTNIETGNKIQTTTPELEHTGVITMNQTQTKNGIRHRIDNIVLYNDLTEIPKDTLILVIDDICETDEVAASVAETLRSIGFKNQMVLYATHGFFTNGFNNLLKYYSEIYTSNLRNKYFRFESVNDGKFYVVNAKIS